jgi:hypothetical protein
MVLAADVPAVAQFELGDHLAGGVGSKRVMRMPSASVTRSWAPE